MTSYYSYYGQPSPGLTISSVVHTYLNLQVFFSSAMKNDVELRTPSNYQITVTDPTTAYDFGALEVTPEEGVTYPTYVNLTVTDCTAGKEYTLVITPDKLQGEDDDYISGSNSISFTGVTESPDVLAAESISLTEIKVTFSKTMSVNEELKDKSNYALNNDLKVLNVIVESNSSVILTTTAQTPGELYELTVS